MPIPSKLAVSRRNLMAAIGAFGATMSVAKPSRANGPGGGSGGPGGGHGGPGGGHGGPGGGHGGHHCLLAGTRLLTPAGERAVESLAIGDLLVTRTGDAKAIRWIGRRAISRTADGSWPTGASPVRVARSALGEYVPARDIYLSAGHAVLVDGVLIPVGDLVNGITISLTEAEGIATLAYFHVEIDGHDVVMADGLAVETLLVSAGIAFDNLAERGASIAAMTPCAPNVGLKGGRDVVRSRLRSAMAPWLDCRQPFDVIRDRLEARAEQAKAA